MAIKACRDYALESKGITNPVVVLPKTAHPAFNKGSKYFGIRLKFVPVDPETMVVRPQDMKRYIGRNTIMVS